MKIIRKLFRILLFVLLLVGGFYTLDRLTDGFNKHQIKSSLPYYPAFEITVSPQEKENVEKILDQPFHYLGKGCQFYAFESDDGKVVIKLLKQKHLRTLNWVHKIPAPPILASYFLKKTQEREERVEKLFSSCKLAFEELREESGLIFIHLNRTPLFGKTVLLVDKLGLKHRISIDDYEFVLQKKAVSVQEAFENSQEEEIPLKVQKLLGLVKARCQKGIRDRDRSFVQNVAFCEETGEAVFIDIGQFYKDDTILSEEQQRLDLQKRHFNLLDWVQRKFPEKAALVEKILF